MQPSDFSKASPGRLAKGPHGLWAFVPAPLPPELSPSWELGASLSRADRAVGELSGLARNLPNSHLMTRPFLSREAVLSSRIEGTQASLSDLLYFEAGQKEPAGSDVREVANYVRALEYGLKRLETFPLSLRFLCEMHEILMSGVRGAHLTPGEFRKSQNWIGPAGCTLNNATYVPPPVPEMMEALSELEKYLHAETVLPPLVRLALVHYQFEAIHPFLDGNGRIGRLLVSVLLCHEGLLRQPLLYLSAFFERKRPDYYKLLLAVSQLGTWHEWLSFFLEGVSEQARDAMTRAGNLLELWQRYRRELSTVRSSALLLRILDRLFEAPVVSIPQMAQHLGVTQRAASQLVQKLVAAGVLSEATGRQRHRLFAAREVIAAIEAPGPG